LPSPKPPPLDRVF